LFLFSNNEGIAYIFWSLLKKLHCKRNRGGNFKVGQEKFGVLVRISL